MVINGTNQVRPMMRSNCSCLSANVTTNITANAGQCSCRNVTVLNKTSTVCSCCIPEGPIVVPAVCPNATCLCRNVTNATTKVSQILCNCTGQNNSILARSEPVNITRCMCPSVFTNGSMFSCNCDALFCLN